MAKFHLLISWELPFWIFWQFILWDSCQHWSISIGGETSSYSHQRCVGVHGGARVCRHLLWEYKMQNEDVILVQLLQTGNREQPSQVINGTRLLRHCTWTWLQGSDQFCLTSANWLHIKMSYGYKPKLLIFWYNWITALLSLFVTIFLSHSASEYFFKRALFLSCSLFMVTFLLKN